MAWVWLGSWVGMVGYGWVTFGYLSKVSWLLVFDEENRDESLMIGWIFCGKILRITNC